jgi:uncharacterized membrane protein YciS (DUF1049 family)
MSIHQRTTVLVVRCVLFSHAKAQRHFGETSTLVLMLFINGVIVNSILAILFVVHMCIHLALTQKMKFVNR